MAVSPQKNHALTKRAEHIRCGDATIGAVRKLGTTALQVASKDKNLGKPVVDALKAYLVVQKALANLATVLETFPEVEPANDAADDDNDVATPLPLVPFHPPTRNIVKRDAATSMSPRFQMPLITWGRIEAMPAVSATISQVCATMRECAHSYGDAVENTCRYDPYSVAHTPCCHFAGDDSHSFRTRQGQSPRW